MVQIEWSLCVRDQTVSLTNFYTTLKQQKIN